MKFPTCTLAYVGFKLSEPLPSSPQSFALKIGRPYRVRHISFILDLALLRRGTTFKDPVLILT